MQIYGPIKVKVQNQLSRNGVHGQQKAGQKFHKPKTESQQQEGYETCAVVQSATKFNGIKPGLNQTHMKLT